MTSPDFPDVVAGYRLVRKLGAGSRADVYLGSAGSNTDEAPRSCAVKLFHPEVPASDVGRELAALTAIDHPHCVKLLDTASAPNGVPILIFERVVRGSIAHLLGERDSLELGEAVTLLAPVAGAMSALHRRGVAHGDIGPSSVHLGARGEPILLGFGKATLLGDGTRGAPLSVAALDAEAATGVDRDQLARFAEVLLDRIRPASNSAAVENLRAWIDSTSGRRRYEFAGELEDRLFDLAAPRALSFGYPKTSRTVVPLRVVTGVPPQPLRERVVTGEQLRPRTRKRRRTPALTVVEQGPRWIVVRVRDSVARGVAGIRAPLWGLAAAVVIAFVAAVMFLPSEGSHAVNVAGKPVLRGQHGSGASWVTSAIARDLSRDDALVATQALLALRATCLRAKSADCLSAVEDPGSAAAARDTAILAADKTGTRGIAPITTTWLQPVGGAALVGVTGDPGTTSVLVLHGKEGWRIRSYQTAQVR